MQTTLQQIFGGNFLKLIKLTIFKCATLDDDAQEGSQHQAVKTIDSISSPRQKKCKFNFHFSLSNRTLLAFSMIYVLCENTEKEVKADKERSSVFSLET